MCVNANVVFISVEPVEQNDETETAEFTCGACVNQSSDLKRKGK